MSKKSSKFNGRPWKILRIALLWARRGGFAVSLNELHKGIKKLHHHHRHSRETPRRGALVYGDRELSFDETPIIHVKMHRPSSLRFKMPNIIPCIRPAHVDFDYDFEFDDDGFNGTEKYLENYSNNRDEDREREDDDGTVDGDDEEEIDSKAEQFIAKFYQEMKLQRQISYLQYQEMIQRGSSS